MRPSSFIILQIQLIFHPFIPSPPSSPSFLDVIPYLPVPYLPVPYLPIPYLPIPYLPIPYLPIPYLLHSSLKGPSGRTLELDFSPFHAQGSIWAHP